MNRSQDILLSGFLAHFESNGDAMINPVRVTFSSMEIKEHLSGMVNIDVGDITDGMMERDFDIVLVGGMPKWKMFYEREGPFAKSIGVCQNI